MYSLLTSWARDTTVVEQKIQSLVDERVQTLRKGSRYRRIVYYFFEKEIQSDLHQELRKDSGQLHNFFKDPEYQALVARSVLGNNSISESVIWDDLTFILNNYLFSQDIFAQIEDPHMLFETTVMQMMSDQQVPAEIAGTHGWISDLFFQCRRLYDDIVLVQHIVQGDYTYKTLVSAFAEHIGRYAVLPRLFTVLDKPRSHETILSLFEESTHHQLQDMLLPSYEASCQILKSELLQPYGSIDPLHNPYSTVVSRLGYQWAHTPWYVKMIATLGIVFISGWLGGWSLWILPIVRGLFAIARSVWQYLELLLQVIHQWYIRYTDYHSAYLNLYDTMIDPDQTAHESISAQSRMTRRYEVVPFSGHELVRDATSYAKTLFDSLMGLLHPDQTISDALAIIAAVMKRSREHHFSLLVVQDGLYPEQVLYRLSVLFEQMKGEVSSEQEKEQYAVIDEVMSTKTYNFRFWTFRNAIRDGVMVSISSGVIGWIGSYLRNRGITGSTTFAAGPSLLHHTATQSDSQFVIDTHILDVMKSTMKAEDLTRFLDVVTHHQQADTLRGTMVQLFGEKQGTLYTNALLDHRWRLTDASGQSTLFSTAMEHGLPVSAHDVGWDRMLHFLHRVYGYKSLQDYESLINQPWLSQTLHGLKNGNLGLEDIAHLDVKQREIIAQAMFYYVPKHDFMSMVTGTTHTYIEGISQHIGTGSSVSGSQQTLSLGDRLLHLLGLGDKTTQTGSVVVTGQISGSQTGVALSGSVGQEAEDTISLGNKLLQLLGVHHTSSQTGSVLTGGITGDSLIQTGTSGSHRWRWDTSRHGSTLTGLQQTGAVVSSHTGSLASGSVQGSDYLGSGSLVNQSSGWMERLSDWRGRLTTSHTIITITGQDTTGSIHSGSTVLTGGSSSSIGGHIGTGSGSVVMTDHIVTSGDHSGWFDRFVMWIKGTPPVKTGSLSTTGLVNTGKIDQVLSGISPEDIATQATGFAQQVGHTSSVWHFPRFTLPVLRKDKKVE